MDIARTTRAVYGFCRTLGVVKLMFLTVALALLIGVSWEIYDYYREEKAREAEQRLQQARQKLERAKTDCEHGRETPIPSGIDHHAIDRLVVTTGARAQIVLGGADRSTRAVRVLKQPYATAEQLRQLLGTPTVESRDEEGGTCLFGNKGPRIPEVLYEWATRWEPPSCQLGLEQKRKTHYSPEFTAVFRPSVGPGLWCVRIEINGNDETVGRSPQDWMTWERR